MQKEEHEYRDITSQPVTVFLEMHYKGDGKGTAVKRNMSIMLHENVNFYQLAVLYSLNHFSQKPFSDHKPI